MDFFNNGKKTSEEAIEHLYKADSRAQQMLYNHHAPKMYAISLRYASCEADAEDILQEGFIKVFQNLGQYRGDGNFEGWMRKIFVNTAIEGIRKRHSWKPLGDQDNDIQSDGDPNGFEHLSLGDLMKMIQRLSDGYRTVFNLYVIEGFSHREIAEMLKISEGTSKSQLSRAKILLQKMLRHQQALTTSD